MTDDANLVAGYRTARRAFIAACQSAAADDISRVHPERGPDGKPLFCDCAAFGPRDAARGLLLIADAESVKLIGKSLRLPKDARLVVVHTLDPYARAWGKPGLPTDWPAKTLADIATEDLSKVKKLTVLDMDGSASETLLVAALPGAVLIYRRIKPEHAEQAIVSAIAAL